LSRNQLVVLVIIQVWCLLGRLGLRATKVGTVEVSLRNLNIAAIEDEDFNIDFSCCPKALAIVQNKINLQGAVPHIRLSIKRIDI
jgi:hypothetical protein